PLVPACPRRAGKWRVAECVRGSGEAARGGCPGDKGRNREPRALDRHVGDRTACRPRHRREPRAPERRLQFSLGRANPYQRGAHWRAPGAYSARHSSGALPKMCSVTTADVAHWLGDLLIPLSAIGAGFLGFGVSRVSDDTLAIGVGIGVFLQGFIIALALLLLADIADGVRS